MIGATGKDHSPEAWARASRLGPTLVVDGELRGREDLVIQGRVRGKILLPESDVLITESARVEAEIQVRDIIVRGVVTGNITASRRVVIDETGCLDGDLSASMISVEDGARFKGGVKILGKA
jgi:cytoskeletal protein CcmA (bactofilin family)